MSQIAASEPATLDPATARGEVFRFFVSAYAITWGLLTPFVLLWHTVLEKTIPPWALLFLPGAYGPTLAALLLAWRRGQARALLRRLVEWRVSWAWYLFALFVPYLTVACAVLLSSHRSAALAGFDPWPGLAVAPLALGAGVFFGPLGEELGWRGYALPRLLSLAGPWRSSLILGVAWTFWHLPLFWLPGAALPELLEPGLASVGLYLAQITAEAGLLTFLFLVTRGNVLLAVIFHLSFNTAETLLYRMIPEPVGGQELELYLLGIAVNGVAAVALLGVLTWRRARTPAMA